MDAVVKTPHISLQNCPDWWFSKCGPWIISISTPGKLLVMQILRPHSRPAALGWGSVMHVSPRPPGDSPALSSWRTTKVCQYSLKASAKADHLNSCWGCKSVKVLEYHRNKSQVWGQLDVLFCRKSKLVLLLFCVVINPCYEFEHATGKYFLIFCYLLQKADLGTGKVLLSTRGLIFV